MIANGSLAQRQKAATVGGGWAMMQMSIGAGQSLNLAATYRAQPIGIMGTVSSVQSVGEYGQVKNRTNKTILIVCIQLIIALFFLIGVDGASRPVRVLYHSYFADLFLPFGLYFLLVVNEAKWPALKPWYVKAGLVFGLCATSELLQYFGIFALARTFDPVDFVMYGAGVLLAALMDTKVFARFIPFWRSSDQ